MGSWAPWSHMPRAASDTYTQTARRVLACTPRSELVARDFLCSLWPVLSFSLAFRIFEMAASLRSPSYDVGQYVECPGPTVDGIHTGMCKAIIPRAIFCTGANSGKRCQRVSGRMSVSTMASTKHSDSATNANTWYGYPLKTADIHRPVLLGPPFHRAPFLRT